MKLLDWLRRLWYPAVPPERAVELFERDRSRLFDQFLAASRATGKPRGLVWSAIEPVGALLLVADRELRRLVGLLPVVARFEPIAGSEMEHVPLAREPRPVTAVFLLDGRTWRATSRAVFNLSPEQVVERSGGRYTRINPRPRSR